MAVGLKVASVTRLDVLSLASILFINVTLTQREQIQALFDRLLESSQTAIGCTEWTKREIDIGNACRIMQRYYPVVKKIEDEMYSQAKEMLMI